MTERAKQSGTWLYRAFVVALLGILCTQFFSFAPEAYDVIRHRSFDSSEQKNDVIRLLQKEEFFTAEEAQDFRSHLEDTDRHMSSGEKEQLIIIRENQKRIGQDLQEIKNLLRNR